MIKPPINSPIDALVDLACRDGVDVRPTLLRVLTDLYVQKPTHSADEETQYLALTLGLIDAVDEATRAAVTASLSVYPAAPRAILERLGVAAATPPAPTAPAGAPDLREAFFAAGSEERRLILLNLEPGASARVSAPASSEIIKLLENAAFAGNGGEFARTLERSLKLSPQTAERVTRDPSGEPIVIAAKALGMGPAVLHRILLFLNRDIGQSVQRVYDLADLFEELPRAAADRMLDIWRGDIAPQRPSQKPVYESVYGVDGARDHRNLSSRRATPLPGRQSERTRGTR
jgi:hypothetical protein